MPGIDDENKTTIMSKDTFQTLEDWFKEIDKGVTNAIKKLKEGQEQIAKQQQRDEERWRRKWIETEASLEKAGIDSNNNHYQVARKKMIKEQEDYYKKLRLEAINDIYKKEVENSTKSAQQRKKQEALANKEINEAWLKKYAELESKGGLTPEQQEDKRQKQEELNLAKKTLIEQTKQTALTKSLNGLMNATLNAVNVGINTYAKYQGGINARLQGSSLIRGTGFNALGSMGITAAERLKFGTNTFGILESRLSSATGIQPYVRTETMLSNLETLVKAGIAANVEQRAFLQSVKEDIADTFDVANSSLLRIVRLQQSDSTAARLGMEAYLTRFLNQVVENTEYLNQTFDTVQESLIEASSQMTMEASTEFEYVVQKWLGALTGTGLSETTAQNIAQAIGYLGSGNVTGFSGSNMQGLLTMAASKAGLDIGNLLNTGLTASTTNTLLNAIANYMVEIGASGNNVVRSQLAQTFGLNVSDIRAAQQLSRDFRTIDRNMMSFTGMYGALGNQMMALPTRMSMGEMIQNVFDNSMFSLASGIASNPALAAIWKITDMIQSTTGGINIPFITAMGSGMDLNATVEQLMKLGIVGISSLGMIGDVISGLGSSLAPASMLQKLGITPWNTSIARGGGLASLISGFTQSSSVYAGQGASEDIYQQTLQQNADKSKSDKTLQPQEDEKTQALPNIYTYLDKRFDPKFDALIQAVNDLRDKVVNGEIEISNYSIKDNLSDLIF